MFRSFIAGQLATLREMTLFYAPNINSYKRFVEGSFAPTAVAWGWTTAPARMRVVGHGHGMRVECRAPGGDVNQYLAVSALIAGGLYGIEQELELPEALEGNAYTSGAERLPTTLTEAADAVRQVDGGARGVRRRGRRALPEQRAASSSRRSIPRSPTGKGCAVLSGSDAAPVTRPDHRICSRRRAGSGMCTPPFCPPSTWKASTSRAAPPCCCRRSPRRGRRASARRP